MNKTEILTHLKTLENPSRQKTNRKLGVEMEQYGVPMTNLRTLAKQLKTQHTLGLELWNTPVFEAMILGVLLIDPKQVTLEQALMLLEKAENVVLVDELSFKLFRKIESRQQLFEQLRTVENPLFARAGWNVAVGLVLDDSYNQQQLESLLTTIEKQLVDAHPDVQWAMNRCLAEIGIKYEMYRQQVLELGLKLGVYKDQKVPKGCTSAYVVDWIPAVVSRKAAKGGKR